MEGGELRVGIQDGGGDPVKEPGFEELRAVCNRDVSRGHLLRETRRDGES